MRFASFNLLSGMSLADGRYDADRLRSAAKTLDADVVGLQEVDRYQPRTSGLDQTRLVAEALGAEHWRFVPALVGTPGGVWRPAGKADEAGTEASYGVGLVSRYPLSDWRVLRMAPARVRAPVMIPGSRQLIWLDDEPRVALSATVTTPTGRLTVCAVHLSFVPGWNGDQLRRVTKHLRSLPGPRILLGDLNMPPPVPRLLTGWTTLARARTYPSPDPRIQLDHVLGHGALPPVLSVSTPELQVSDHRALVVELAPFTAA